MLDLYQGVGGGTGGGGAPGGGYYLIVLLFYLYCCCLLSFMTSVSCQSDSHFACFLIYYLFSLPLVPLTRRYWYIEIFVCRVKLLIETVSDHYSVDFLGKERVF